MKHGEFAKKKEKQEQEALLKPQQAIGSSQEKKSKEQSNAPAVESKDWVEETPAGHRKTLKSLNDDFQKAYFPKVVEPAWYSYWEKQDMFKPRTKEDGSLKSKGKNMSLLSRHPMYAMVYGMRGHLLTLSCR